MKKFRLGLTGSIGMGKSTTAQMFVAEGCDLWDADAAVHRMYAPGGSAVQEMEITFPDVIVEGVVSREKLKSIISADPTALEKIEKIVHPLVAKDRDDFFRQAKSDIVVFDIPLLFEAGSSKIMDAIVCVTVSPEIQEKRVLARGKMTKEQFELIRSKQMPDPEKQELSDYVIETDSIEHARKQVRAVIADIREKISNA